MRKLILIIICVGMGSIAWTQTSPEEVEKHNDVLTSPEGWLKESFDFPLGFAPSIEYTGFEELRFAKTWNDSTSQEFWSYMFVWYLDADPEMTSDKMTIALSAYYDGLMGVKNSKSKIQKLNDGTYMGSVQTFDQFFTKKDFVLNVKMKPLVCPKAKKYAFLFYLSPFSFDKKIWPKLESLTLVEKCE